jgi:glucokinase
MQHAIGIDFGGTSIKSGLVLGGEIVQRGTPIDTQKCSGPAAIIDALVETIAELRGSRLDVVGVGVGLPGVTDSVNGVVHELTNVPGWIDVPLRDLLFARTGLRAIIENDANAMAFGEWKYGAARDGRHVICITLGTGVGGALILDGRLYRGAQLGAGEIGHLSIDYRGRPGPFGNNGALEEYVGNSEISARAAALYLAAGRPDVRCTPAELAQAAGEGDPIALSLWEAVGTEIGAALASVIWVLNPDTIVIGGGVARAGELLFEPIRRTICARTHAVFHEQLRILPATLGNDAGIIGNAALVLET